MISRLQLCDDFVAGHDVGYIATRIISRKSFAFLYGVTGIMCGFGV